jgi:hypothetical protein
VIDGSLTHISEHVSYATNYHSVLALPAETILISIRPNRITSGRKRAPISAWLNDNDPFRASGPTNQDTDQHLTGLLQAAGRTWRSYQEDIDLTRNASGQLTNVPLPRELWTVPLTSFSGSFATGFANAFNFSPQFNYAAKHNPMVFFTNTNGGNDPTPDNPLSSNYAPLQQLFHGSGN